MRASENGLRPGKPLYKNRWTYSNISSASNIMANQKPFTSKLGRNLTVHTDNGAGVLTTTEGTIYLGSMTRQEFTPKNIRPKMSVPNMVYAIKVEVPQ